MESPNVEVVRRIYAAWESGDFSRTEWAHPDIEVVRPDGMDGMAPGDQKGLAAMREMWRDFLGIWETLSVTAGEFRELDGGRVLVLANFSGRARASGLEAEAVWREAASIFHVRDGRVAKMELYIDARRALDDLGIESSGD